MHVCINDATLEVTQGRLYATAWGREVFIKFDSGLPRWEFARERAGTDVQLWGLGLYAVVSNARSV